jgi:hypothetical protein
MILYLKYPKDATKKALRSDKHIWQTSKIPNQLTKIRNVQAEKEIRNTIASKNT